jgi:hypothetical protein
MNNEFLNLTGWVVDVNAGDQSFVIGSTKSSNRLRVYADNALFRKLDHVLTVSQFHGGRAKEITGTFYIQGRVLVKFCIGSNLHELTNVLYAAVKGIRAKKKDLPAK